MSTATLKVTSGRIAHWLFEPEGIHDVARRRTGSLSASLAFSELLLLLLAYGITRSPVLLPLLAASLLAYIASRTGYIFAGSTLMVLGLSVWYVLYMGELPDLDGAGLRSLIAWSILPIILAGSLFDLRGTLLTGLLNLGVILSIPLLDARFTGLDILPILGLPLTATALVLVVMQHRDGLERLRRTDLETALETVRQSEQRLEQRVAERTQELEQRSLELEFAIQEAQRASNVKSQFLASMSHELRTPLNSILTFSDLLMMGTFGEITPEQTEYLGKIRFSGRHLLELINDVLDISKMEAGMMKLFIEDDFHVGDEITRITASIEQMLGSKPVRLLKEIEDDLPLLTVDKRRVRQVLLNLLSNAVKFTQEGTITLRALRQADGILFAVIDTGPGIPAEQQQIIFEPFVQTETGVKHAGGTGLGLPISKRLVEAHGGKLWVESQPGQGAAFYFIVPIAPAQV